MITGFLSAGKYMILPVDTEDFQSLQTAVVELQRTNTMQLHLEGRHLQGAWTETLLSFLDEWRLRNSEWLMGLSMTEILDFALDGIMPQPFRGSGPVDD